MGKETESSKERVAQRSIKVGELIAKGAKDTEIMQYFNISRRTLYRDLEYVRALSKGTLASDYACVRMVEMRDNLLRGSLVKVNQAETFDEYIRASRLARKLLTDLERTLERLGIIPSLKYTTHISKNDNSLKIIQEEALKALNSKDTDDF